MTACTGDKGNLAVFGGGTQVPDMECHEGVLFSWKPTQADLHSYWYCMLVQCGWHVVPAAISSPTESGVSLVGHGQGCDVFSPGLEAMVPMFHKYPATALL